MIKEIVLPDLGEGIESATISEVPLSAGEHVKKDDVLLVLESDKASMEIPSDYDGKITEVLVEEGKDVVTGEPLFKIEIQDSTKEEIEEETKKEDKTKEQTEVKVESKAVFEPNIARVGDDVFASPGVRRLARELGIDLRLIKGTGAKGRTTKEDLHSYIRIKMQEGSGLSKPPKKPIDFSQWGDIEYQKLTKVNKITGSRLQEAWQDIPHVTQHNSADITDLNDYRKKLKSEAEKEGIKITFLPFLMKASVLVLKEMIRFNSSLDENEENLIIKKYFHLGVAVDTPSGLMVPCVRDVDKKTIKELSEELADISQRARDKKLRPDELKGSTFTISSLGGLAALLFPQLLTLQKLQSWAFQKASGSPYLTKTRKSLFLDLLCRSRFHMTTG